MKPNSDTASGVKNCARKMWAHTKIFIASIKSDLKETRDEMFVAPTRPRSACNDPLSTACCCLHSYA